MKKRIISLIILALTLVGVFAFASCGKSNEEIACPHEGCDSTLKIVEGEYVCEKLHVYKDCINEDCEEKLSGVVAEYGYCPRCGTSQEECPECKDNKVDGVYCTSCGRQVPKDSSISDIFGKPWSEREKAISNSALILCFGMLGIFIVTGVIITFILVLNTIVEKVKQSKNRE